MSSALRIAHGEFGRVALLDMDRSLVRHAHPHCHVLIKVGGGDTKFVVNNMEAPLTDTTAVLVNAWEPHAYVHDPRRDNALILALYIEPSWLRGFRSNWSASAAPGFFEHSVATINRAIRRLSMDLAAEMVHAPESTEAQERLLASLMIAVIEHFVPWRSIGASLREQARVKCIDYRVGRVVNAMRANPTGQHSIQSLAKAAGMSRAHFFRVFESSTGTTPHVFLNTLKIEHAVNAVVHTHDSISNISERLGFSVPAHFARFFRDHCSVAPTEFRQVARSS